MKNPAFLIIVIFIIASITLVFTQRLNRNSGTTGETKIISVTTSPNVFLSPGTSQTASPIPTETSSSTAATKTSPSSLETSQSQSFPASKNIVDVPFIVQAPFANWDELHEEACEEASILMVNNFLSGRNSISKEEAENQIQDLVKWESENGYGVDVSIEQVVEIFQKKFFRQSFEILKDPTLDDLKKHLSQNHLIIVPAAGRSLENPYYTPPGPQYHMLVVRGYTEKEIITNDPGTKRGENYRYPFGTFFNAIHDWTGDKETVTNGKKKVLVITN